MLVSIERNCISCTLLGKRTTVRPLWKSSASVFRKKSTCSYLRASKRTPGHSHQRHENVCPHKNLSQLFLAVLFVIAPKWKQPGCPSTGDWRDKSRMAVPWDTTQQQKGTNGGCMQQPGWISGSCAELKKPTPKGRTLCDSIYITFSK